MGNTAVQNSTDTSSFLRNHLPDTPIPDPSLFVTTVLSPFYLHWFHLHVLISAQTPHWTEGKTTVGHRKWGRPQPVPSWRDHSHSSEKVKQRAEQRCLHSSKAKTGQCTKAHDQYYMHVYGSPRVLPIACIHVHGYSCSNLSIRSVQQDTTSLTPAAISLHCLPLTSFWSHAWLVYFLPCLNFLSHRHIRALPLSSLSSLSELLSDSSNKTTLEQCFSTFFYCGVFSQGMYITAVKTQKQKKGGFLSGHTSKRKITWRTDRWK